MQDFNISKPDNAGGNSDPETRAFFNENIVAAAVTTTAKSALDGDIDLPTVTETIRHGKPITKQLVAEFTLPIKHENERPRCRANMDGIQTILLSSKTDLVADHSYLRELGDPTKNTRSMVEEPSEKLVSAPKIRITEKEIGTRQLKLKQVEDQSEEQIHPSDLLVGSVSEDLAAPTTQRQPVSFIHIPIDVRRLVYDEFEIPITKTIHLTHSPETTVFEVRRPDRHSVSKDVLNLFLVCRQVSDELADILYGKNTFVIMPGEHNYNTPATPDVLSNSSIWLAHQRLQTRKKVKKLRVYFDFYLQARIRNITAALSEYPEVRIAVQPLATSRLRARLRLEQICASIQRARFNARITAWSDSGSPEIASILTTALSDALEGSLT